MGSRRGDGRTSYGYGQSQGGQSRRSSRSNYHQSTSSRASRSTSGRSGGGHRSSRSTSHSTAAEREAASLSGVGVLPNVSARECWEGALRFEQRPGTMTWVGKDRKGNRWDIRESSKTDFGGSERTDTPHLTLYKNGRKTVRSTEGGLPDKKMRDLSFLTPEHRRNRRLADAASSPILRLQDEVEAARREADQ